MDGISGIRIDDYRYELPENRIAKRPLTERDNSKLLVFRDNMIYERPFKCIAEELPPDNLLVRNNTRVIQARLTFLKKTGAAIEIFCLEPFCPSDYEQNFGHKKSVGWRCLVGNAKKWKKEVLEKEIKFDKTTSFLRANKIDQNRDHFIVEFSWDNEELCFADILDLAGSTPIPPYLNRDAEKDDRKRYQTIYAETNGSVAAPTAGLHFTNDVFSSIKTKNIDIEEITLHVGAGTFRPVNAETIKAHVMHLETIVIRVKTLERIANHLPGQITAIGTTSLRSLESLYWLGLKIRNRVKVEVQDLIVDQWDAYSGEPEIKAEECLKTLVSFLRENKLNDIRFSTRLIIVPGYKFRIVNRLITNFHQPGSTLLLLVAAFIGKEWKSVYEYALKNDFRFLSYGDSSLLHLNNENQ